MTQNRNRLDSIRDLFKSIQTVRGQIAEGQKELARFDHTGRPLRIQHYNCEYETAK